MSAELSKVLHSISLRRAWLTMCRNRPPTFLVARPGPKHLNFSKNWMQGAASLAQLHSLFNFRDYPGRYHIRFTFAQTVERHP